jgi:hypothetical protein
MTALRLVFAIAFLFLSSCQGPDAGKSPGTGTDTSKPAMKDSSRTATDAAGDDDDDGHPKRYVEDGRLDLGDQVFTLTTRYAVVDGKVDEEDQHSVSTTYFVHLYKKTRKADTLKSDLDIIACSSCHYYLRDLTRRFGSNFPIVRVVTPAEDIYYTNTFLCFREGRLQALFSVMDADEEGIELHRVGSSLTGFISGRDEVVEDVEHNYPIRIDTKTLQEDEPVPDPQYIGFETKVTQSFRAHRVINGRVDSSLVSVPAGATVTVDTFYRALGKVRLLLADSTVVEVKKETANEKLEHNNAW